VIVPGVADLDRPIAQGVLQAIRGAVDRGARVASVYSGAFVLAVTGALDGMRATIHWQAAAELARRYPCGGRSHEHHDRAELDRGAEAACAHALTSARETR
jgi:transcriptional regulator GlxA family with amidase domain